MFTKGLVFLYKYLSAHLAFLVLKVAGETTAVVGEVLTQRSPWAPYVIVDFFTRLSGRRLSRWVHWCPACIHEGLKSVFSPPLDLFQRSSHQHHHHHTCLSILSIRESSTVSWKETTDNSSSKASSSPDHQRSENACLPIWRWSWISLPYAWSR